MDLTTNIYLEEATLDEKIGFFKNATKNPFLDTFVDPLCKLNLNETSEFVKSFPVANNVTGNNISSERAKDNGVNLVTKRNLEAPPTPGRPIFSFSNGGFPRKSFPSKWDDAEKWLVNGNSFNDSPIHNHGSSKPFESSKMFSRQCSGYKPQLDDDFPEKSKVNDQKVSKVFSTVNGVSLSTSTDVLLKDKFPNPKFGCSEPMQEGFLFRNAVEKSMDNAIGEIVVEVKHRDMGTEMTPLGSSTTSRCPTPFKSMSPARHTTPADRSGPLALDSYDSSNTMDITQLQDCHLTKLHSSSVTSNWSSREEEEEDVSKSLRHFEMSNECRKSISESRTCSWEEDEKTKICLRYQREEAKIEAWVNLQSAKAEAESRKLEVKIQKMRSDLEEKLMKRMADVHRKAEEWRATSQFEHSEHIRKVGQQARKVIMKKKNFIKSHSGSGCFPCNNHHI